ncbi:MAG: RHS repeat-associated core domain-containing protein, partial [Ignavibacteriaceae bacterium]
PVAADAFGYVLGYYNDPINPDYTPIDPAVSTTTGMDATTIGNVKPLYNGNISRMYSWLQGQDMGGLGMNYRYDQLNRLKIQQAFTIANTGGQSLLGSDAYGMDLTYDPNGNIMKLDRKGRVTNSAMDNLTYNYYPGTNKLAYVQDAVNSNYPETGTVVNGTVTDIDNQGTGNYMYDEIGNLIKDNSENIDSIKWNLQNKIASIKKTDGTEIDFAYDALGNRVYKKNSSGSSAKETYYVHDAQGNILSTYELKNDSLHWQEQNLYGSSRIGVWHPGIVINTTTQAVPDTIDWQNIKPLASPTVEDSTICGSKQYELTNHLGNVLATISDRRLQTTPAAQGTSGITADLITATDYYAFGMQMPGRNFSGNSYRFGFNGKENDNDVKGDGNQQDYGLRFYDPRLGKFLSIDPLTKKYPELTPYQFASNRPIDGIDLNGLEHVTYLYKMVDGKAQLQDVRYHGVDLNNWHGVRVGILMPNGEMEYTDIHMNAPPKPEKPFDPGFMNKLQSKMMGDPANYGQWEDKAPLQSAEAGIKVNVKGGSLDGTLGLKTSDESGSEKSGGYFKISETSKWKPSVNIKGYLKLNLSKPTNTAKEKYTLNLGFFYIQTQNTLAGAMESIEFGVQGKESIKPDFEVAAPLLKK